MTDLVRTATPADKLAKTQGKGLRDLVRAKTRRSMLLVDVSGSMDSRIATGERRIEALRKVVATLLKTHPVPVGAFGLPSRRGVGMVDGNHIPEPEGGTPLAEAIEFARTQGANHAVVVTDGMPDNDRAAFDEARQFGGPIDVFFIGDAGEYGAQFCQRLADLTGGTANVTDLGVDEQKQLGTKIAGLLGDGSL